MADIAATTPVTAPAVASMVFDKWFMTQMVGKYSPTTGPTIITLQRANLTNGVWTMMPNTSPDATVTFNLDVFKEMATNPLLATAFEAVLTAVNSYATAKHLI